MKPVWTVARRELKALFDQPTGYILLIVFIAINDFMFFRSAYLFGAASLRPMLELLPWMFLFFVPAVTMRALAEDVRTGTIELVLAQPITEGQLLLGKYLGQLLFVWIGLALTLPIPVGLSLAADLHAGVIVAQYVGAGLLAAAFVAIGIWTSALTRYQMTAFIVGVAVMFVLVLVGLDPVLVGLPPGLNAIAARLGVLSHFQNIARGVIDLRDAVYFVTLTAAFLTLGYAALLNRKLSHRGEPRRRLRLATALLVVGLVVVNLFGRHIRGRLDLTPGRAYTLSRATRDLVRDLDDIVTLRLFASKELPSEVALLRRDLDDLLRDYRAAGDGMLRVVERDPADDEAIAEEARTLGIPPVQFNVMGESEVSIREGYLGLAIQYADETESIPFIQRTQDLEYRLTSTIRNMTTDDRRTVGLFTASSPGPVPRSFDAFREGLRQSYDVRTVALPGADQPSEDLDVLVLIGAPDSLPPNQVDRINRFLAGGGHALVMAEGMDLTGQGEFAFPKDVLWNPILEPYGVGIRSDMVYDRLSNEQAQVPTQMGIRMIVPYPLWVRAISTRAIGLNADIETVFTPWTSSIDTTAAPAGTVIPLLVTSEAAGVDSMMAMLSPRRQYPDAGLGTQVLAVAVNPAAAEGGDGGSEVPAGRIVVIGSVSWLDNRFAGGNRGNLTFALNAVDWLAQDEALVAIRAKDRTPPSLVFSSAGQKDFVKHANVIGVPLLLAVAAVLHLMKRRQRARQSYARRPREVTV